MSSVSHNIDRFEVDFDDPSLIGNAGLLLCATIVKRLGLVRLVDEKVSIPSSAGGFAPGRKIATLVHAMVAGATHIDHVDVLRAGSTGTVLGHRVMAPSTLGTFLRGFTFGHVRQLESVVGELLGRAWSHTVVPDRMVVDVDSTICEVSGVTKAGASYGYTKVFGLHPLVASRADTGEILAARLRKGSANTQRGAKRFCEELVARLHRAGATGLVFRFDSGFWSKKTLAALERLGVSYTMAIRANTKGIIGVISKIDEDAWVDIGYTDNGQAQVAETNYKGRRLIVRRTRLIGDQAELWPDWRHFAFLTDLDGDAIVVDAFHRERAQCELDIRDLKEGTGATHMPSANFCANAAWLQCAVIAHNLSRWTQTLGGLHAEGHRPALNRTIRTRFTSMPARLVNRSGTPRLRTPKNWPWQTQFNAALTTLRSLNTAIT